MGRWIHLAAGATCLLAMLAPAQGDPSPLTATDRAQFAWFDGIGLPSCAGKPYVRVRWVRAGAPPDIPRAKDVWEVDGFVVAERAGMLTLLDGDLWPRKVPRTPAPGWTGGVTTLDLQHVAHLATGRLNSMRTDPGAVEGMDEMYRGIRLRFGDEAQSVALARHCAENDLEVEAHALLEAARALPPALGADSDEELNFEELVASQLAEGVMWRILFDFADPETSRAALLTRARGWIASFPDALDAERVEDMVRILPGMVEEDAEHPAIDAQALAKLAPAEQARALLWMLRDQGGDVVRDRKGRVGVDLGADDTPARRLVALGRAAIPALVEALRDERFTRAVLFIQDTSPERLFVARVGDFARVILETITGTAYGEISENAPSLFQYGKARDVQRRWRRWLERNSPDEPGEKGGSK